MSTLRENVYRITDFIEFTRIHCNHRRAVLKSRCSLVALDARHLNWYKAIQGTYERAAQCKGAICMESVAGVQTVILYSAASSLYSNINAILDHKVMILQDDLWTYTLGLIYFELEFFHTWHKSKNFWKEMSNKKFLFVLMALMRKFLFIAITREPLEKKSIW